VYYTDLTPYDFDNTVLAALNIGWLDNQHDYPKGKLPQEFIERLWLFCNNPVCGTWGYHECELCLHPTFGVDVSYNGAKLHLGSAEIRVIGKGGTLYAAPDFIFHYVTVHDYLPPQEFIEAVLNGVSPVSPEYLAFIEKNFPF